MNYYFKKNNIDVNKLYPFRKTDYSCHYFLGKKSKYLLKERSHKSGIINEYKTIEFLKSRGFLHVPSSFLLKSGERIFIAQIFIKSPLVNFNKITLRKFNLICKAIGKVHNIRQAKKKPISLFLKKKFSLIDRLISNCAFLNEKIKLRGFLEEYNLIIKILKNFQSKIGASKLFLERIRYSFLHGELNREHFVFYKKKLYLLDWESSEFGDPAYDLASLFNERAFPKNIFLNSYKKYINVTKTFLKRLMFYRILRHICNISYNLLDALTTDYDFSYMEKAAYIAYKKYFIKNLNDLKNIINDI